jgi:hypothetical protein
MNTSRNSIPFSAPLTSVRAFACLAAIALSGCAGLKLPELGRPTESPAPVTAPAPVAVPAPAAAPLGAAAPLNPALERRGKLTATGYAVIGVQPDKNGPQQRLMAIRAAKIDAYRGLAEQVYGLYIDSSTTVGELMIKSDTFRTRVEGVIFGAVLSSITPMNNDTYEVTLTLDRSAVAEMLALYLEPLGAANAASKMK